jgi:putative lipoprotein
VRRGAPLVAALTVALFVSSAPEAHADERRDPWFGPDKALHFGATFGLAGAGYGLGAAAGADRPGRLALGASIALGAGLGKEVADALGLGTPSWKDFTWDVLGTVLGVTTAFCFDLALSGPRR